VERAGDSPLKHRDFVLFLGVIGEYLGRVYEEVKGRPHYVIGQVIRGGKRDGA